MADWKSALIPRSMTNPKIAKKPQRKSTQGFLDIKEIRDGIVVLQDGSVRAVTMVSSLNFSLKSNEEQEAIIYSYQNFLNGLDFPIQIVVQSRKLNIDPYLQKLRDAENKQTSELLRVQTAEYREYIQELIDIANIMSKQFYVVVAYHPDEQQVNIEGQADTQAPAPKKGFFGKLLGSSGLATGATFDTLKASVLQRAEHIRATLGALGLSVVQLDTQELIELYYNTYNPDVQEQQRLVGVDQVGVVPGAWEGPAATPNMQGQPMPPADATGTPLQPPLST